MQASSKPADTTKSTVPEPTACDYRKGSCLPYLRNLDKYLQLRHTDLHTYIHKRYVLHLQSGKRAIECAAVLADIAEPNRAPPGLATPRRRRAPAPDAPDTAPDGAPIGNLSADESQQYKILPGLIEDAETRLSAIILQYISSEAGRDQLVADHGTRGTAMLQALEIRGTPDSTTFQGHQLRQVRLEQLRKVVQKGVPNPSSQAWASYDKAIRAYAEAAGGISEADHHGYLFSAITRWPERLRDRMRDDIPLGFDPVALHSSRS